MQPSPGYKTGNQFVSYQQVILVILHIQAFWFTCSQRLLNYLAYQSLWMYLIILVTQCTIVLIRKNIDIFHIRTIVHWVTNLSWFCNQTSYLMFSILGQWNYEIWNLSWFCLHISPLTPFFFHIMTINLSCFCIHIIKFNIKSTV